ncbi:MAG TPA: DUF3347 domain-containing protein [Chitinophaga sp.]|uniref:DUF3347 domain-containing protein n=1 Tax=Chitinophaga sp. TaxID=1869181 RepID=UPI002C7497CF|nr:DUF3347 domain-containing protein [Chitinophaga sp.]HVI48754.1 DUF3347 domain-containing protein [Chitinophaga sp.]
MKRLFITTMVIAAIAFTACNSGNTSHEAHEHDSTTAAAGETAKAEAVGDNTPPTAVQPQFSNIDPKVAASLKTVVARYLQIKNGLAADNSGEAASNGKAMAEAMQQLDKSALTPEQQKVYTENEEDLKEHAEHIGKNEGNIDHQREHFAQMSEDVYALVKAYGGGQPLYHDFCPMYDNNKGALWLSETKEVKNPYFGNKMPDCGVVKEEIK